MQKFEIIVGSVLGATEYVADALQEVLTQSECHTNIHLAADLSELDKASIWVICTSTHGAGDLPDNIQPFAKQLASTDLNGQQFLIVGLGDTSYDTYCHGAIKMETLMCNAGAKLLVPALHIDVLQHPIPENIATEWLNNWLKNLC